MNKIVFNNFLLMLFMINFSAISFAQDEYQIGHNVDANNCEFHVHDFAIEETSHSGIAAVDMVVTLAVTEDLDGELLATGQWVEYLDLADNLVKTKMVYGHRYSSFTKYGLSFAMERADMDDSVGYIYQPIQFAYFIDVKRPSGVVARIWMSNKGGNFRFKDVMRGSTYTKDIPSGKAVYSNQNSPLFNQKRACN